MLAIAGTQGFSISPETCGPLGGHWTRGIYGMESPSGSAPALAAETRVTGVTFHNFDAASSCGKSLARLTPLVPGPAHCAYRPRIPASCVLYIP